MPGNAIARVAGQTVMPPVPSGVRQSVALVIAVNAGRFSGRGPLANMSATTARPIAILPGRLGAVWRDRLVRIKRRRGHLSSATSLAVGVGKSSRCLVRCVRAP